MNLVIDGRPLVGHRTGIGVHTAEIARRLTIEPWPLIASHAAIEDRTGIEHCRFRVDETFLGVVWQQRVLPQIEAEIVWGPHGTLPLTLRRPSVVTLHDFTSITMPWRHRMKTLASFNLFITRSLEKATRVAAVSRVVAEEAVRGFGVPRSKIEIVPNGVDEFFSPAGEESDYILYAGTIEPRKGIDDLIAIWRSLPTPRPRLILCGDRGWGIRIPEHREIQVTGYVPKERLRGLYRNARLFVYPSRSEGFGLPPLEAMACGAPVIATRTGAVEEYAGNAAIVIPSNDRAALRDAMIRLLRDDGLRRELRSRGPEQASRFRWDESARRMMELLSEAVRCE